MKLVDKLFALGSLAAAAAGITEINASRQRWLDGARHNYATPLFMVMVKALRIPKFAALAKTGEGNWLPVVSAVAALIIWAIALLFSVLPPPDIPNRKAIVQARLHKRPGGRTRG
tara:strand:- start:111 stop:455 length:345 start_codon:yes stop_codon:yes gene_type:complete